MREIYTDLVYETVMDRSLGTLTGITSNDITHFGLNVNRIEIMNREASQKTGKREGKYATVFCPKLLDISGKDLENTAKCISAQIEYLAPLKNKSVLVAGLGNTGVIADALGPLSISNVIVSRHIKENFSSLYESLQLGEISAIAPGVLGQTGVESGEIIKAVAKKVEPDVIIAIDSLMAGKVTRLAKTVQLSNAGITPGSGIGNHRYEISEETMGVPVISIGVPLVINASTLAYDLTGKAQGIGAPDQFVVTPKFVDATVKKAAALLGYAINMAVHQDMTVEDMVALLA